MRLTMLFHANLPLSLWVDVFLTTVYLINRLPYSVLQYESAYHKLYKRHPNYKGLRVLGCQYFPSLRHQGGSKFTKKTYPCVFIGYNPIHKGYRCLEPKTRWVYISWHVVFDEHIFLIGPNKEVATHLLWSWPKFLLKMSWLIPKIMELIQKYEIWKVPSF